MRTLRSTIGLAAALAAASAGLATLGGCRDDRSGRPPRQFFPDMDDQPKYKPQSTSRFFTEFVGADGERYGRTQRPPIEGAVPFGRELHASWAYAEGGRATVLPAGVDVAERSLLLGEDDEYFRGWAVDGRGEPITDDATGQPAWTPRIPARAYGDDASGLGELIDVGREQYAIYCLPCHGGTGLGDGMVGRRWAYPLPKYTDALYQRGAEKGDDGYLFHVIRHGVPNEGGAWALRMPGYARKLSVRETWGIVAYIRTLQAAADAELDMVPDGVRRELDLDARVQALVEPDEEGSSS